jgi:hypothetical protein
VKIEQELEKKIFINYEISYKHYILFLFAKASWLLEKLQMGVIKQNIN